MIEDARLAWIAKLPPKKQFRIDNRLSSFRTYLLPSAVLRIFCEKYRSSSNAAPSSFSLPFRNAVFVAHVLALCLILVPAFRAPVAGGIIMLCFIAASFHSFNLTCVAPASGDDTYYLHYIPRCSAIFVSAAAFLAFAQRQWITAVIMFLLIFFWHAGSALIWCPLILAAWGLSSVGLCKYKKGRIVVIASLFLLSVLFSAFIDLLDQLRLWFPLIIFSLAIVINSRLPQSLTKTLMATAAFLFLTQLVIILFDMFSVGEWFVRVTGNPLVATIPDRLEGTRHIASVTLLMLILLIAARFTTEHYKLSHIRNVILVGFQMVVLLLGIWANHKVLRALISGKLPFFSESDAHIKRVSTNYYTLDSLDPNQEETFFASLGDFLILNDGETHNKAAPSEGESDEAKTEEPGKLAPISGSR